MVIHFLNDREGNIVFIVMGVAKGLLVCQMATIALHSMSCFNMAQEDYFQLN